jgi:hypothetical protein
MGRDRIVHANGVPFRVETFGDPRDTAILLIGGAAGSLDWCDEFCDRLAVSHRCGSRRSLTHGTPPSVAGARSSTDRGKAACGSAGLDSVDGRK